MVIGNIVVVVSKKKQKEANESVRKELMNLADKIDKLSKVPNKQEEVRKMQKKELQMLGLIDTYGREVNSELMKFDTEFESIKIK